MQLSKKQTAAAKSAALQAKMAAKRAFKQQQQATAINKSDAEHIAAAANLEAKRGTYVIHQPEQKVATVCDAKPEAPANQKAEGEASATAPFRLKEIAGPAAAATLAQQEAAAQVVNEAINEVVDSAVAKPEQSR